MEKHIMLFMCRLDIPALLINCVLTHSSNQEIIVDACCALINMIRADEYGTIRALEETILFCGLCKTLIWNMHKWEIVYVVCMLLRHVKKHAALFSWRNGDAEFIRHAMERVVVNYCQDKANAEVRETCTQILFMTREL